MQTQMLERESIRAKFSVTVPADDVNKAYSVMLQSLGRQVKIPGFRPGRAPRGVVEAKIGKDALAQEVRDALVETYYPQAVRELELFPVHAHFHAHEPVEGEDYSFEVEVDLYPEVELPNLGEIVIDNEAPQVSDEMIAETVEGLRRENAVLIPVDRPAEPGDYVLVESQGTGSTLPIDLETVSPSLAEQFLGRSIGDALTLELGSPDEDEDAEDEDVEDGGALEAQAETSENVAEAGEVVETEEAGDEGETGEVEAGAEGALADSDDELEDSDEDNINPLAIDVVIRDIKAKEKPEVGDEFAQTLGFDSWEETETQIRRSLQAQLNEEAFEAQREEFMDKLTAESDFDLPLSLVNRRKRGLLENLARDLDARGIALRNYLEELDEKGNRDAFEGELDEAARNAVKRDLVLEKLMEVRGTALSDEEFSAAIRALAQFRETDATKLRRDLGEEGLANYRFMLTRDKAVRETVLELLGAGLEADEDEDNASAQSNAANAPDDATMDMDVESTSTENTDAATEEPRGA